MFITIDSYIILTAAASIAIFVLGIRAERRRACDPGQPTRPAAAALRRAA